MSNRPYFFAVVFLLLSSCALASKDSPQKGVNSSGPLNEVSLGVTKERVLSILGQPQSKSFEEFQTIKYEVWNYKTSDGLPAGFLSIDPKSDLVAGRGVWISDQQPEKNMSYVELHIFPKSKFENFKTCDKHWGTTFRIDRQRGILVGARRNEVFLIEWADAELTKLWIHQFTLDCPQEMP